jgi:hypothetical protein
LSASLPQQRLDFCNETALTPLDSPGLDRFGINRRVGGRDVYVFTARVFADFGKSSLGMFLR